MSLPSPHPRTPLNSPWVLVLVTLFATMIAAGSSLWSDGSQTTHYEWSGILSSLKVELRGEIEFTDDDVDVRKLSRRGYLEIEQRDGFKKRRIEIRPGDDGAIDHRYFVGGDSRPFDDDARRWLGKVLPDVIRNTGIGAEQRTARILESQGVSGVLDEIDRIDSGGARARYCLALLERADLDLRELIRFGELIEDIPTSGDRSRVLIAVSRSFLDAGAHEAFFEATRTIPSSGDHARVLLSVLGEQERLSDAGLSELLRSAGKIASSGDKGRVLIEAAPSVSGSDDLVAAYLDAADTIPSSGDQRRALSALAR